MNQETNNTRAFRKGLRQLRVIDVQPAKDKLMAILGVTTKQSFIKYADGKTATLDVDKARRIEQLFAEYGVTDCWGA